MTSHARHLLLSALERPGGLADYNVALSWLVHGELDEDRLRESVRRLVVEQEGLRTIIPDPRAEYAIVRPTLDFGWCSLPVASADDWAAVGAVLRTPFDFAHGPTLRVALQRRDDATLVILLMHHVLLDGWAGAYLATKLWDYYAENVDPRSLDTAPASEAGRPFRDFVAWQEGALAEGAFARDVAYWARQLAGVEDVLYVTHPLGTDRGVAPRRFPVRYRSLELPPRARYSSRRNSGGITCYVATLTAFGRALCRMLDAEEVIVCTSVNARPSDEFANTIGNFNNTILLRLPLGGDEPISTLATRTRSVSLDALENSGLPHAVAMTGANLPSSIGGIDSIPFVCTVMDEAEPPCRAVSATVELEPVQLPYSGGITTPMILNATTRDAVLTSAELLLCDGLYSERQLERLTTDFVDALAELNRPSR